MIMRLACHATRKGLGCALDRQCIVTYEILALALLYCMEWCGSDKKQCNTLGDVYPLVDLSDVDGLEHLAWAVHKGMFIPGDPPRLTGLHDRSRIIAGMTLCLIYHGKTVGEHCPPCTVASFNAKHAMRLMQ